LNWSLEFVDGCKVGHHHAKCLGPIYSAENLPANSIQFIGDLVRQWKYERGVNALKWNIQPRAVVERDQVRLSPLVLKFMMMCSARAFFLRILSTAKSWLKWLLVNLESTVSRS
jgi:hypothetical protein